MFGRVFNEMSHRGGAMLRVTIGLLAVVIAFGACAVTGSGGNGTGRTATDRVLKCVKAIPTVPALTSTRASEFI